MREFVAAGGELIIHGALLIRNSPTPDLSDYFFKINKGITITPIFYG
jgi:hypothetical protein